MAISLRSSNCFLLRMVLAYGVSGHDVGWAPFTTRKVGISDFGHLIAYQRVHVTNGNQVVEGEDQIDG